MIPIPPDIADNHIRDSYLKGDVLFWEAYEGKERDKNSYFILLTGCSSDSFIAVRTTRRVQLYSGPQMRRHGHEVVTIAKGEVTFFEDETIVDLTWRNHFRIEELKKLLGGRLKKIGTLPDLIIQRIDVAVTNSVTLTEREITSILSSKPKS